MSAMDDIVETKLGKSLEDLIKEQKHTFAKKQKPKKKPATPQAVNKAGKPKVRNSRQGHAPFHFRELFSCSTSKIGHSNTHTMPTVFSLQAGKAAAEAKKPSNQKNQKSPGVKSLKQVPLKATKGGGVQKKGQASGPKVVPVTAGRKKTGVIIAKKGGPAGNQRVVVVAKRQIGGKRVPNASNRGAPQNNRGSQQQGGSQRGHQQQGQRNQQQGRQQAPQQYQNQQQYQPQQHQQQAPRQNYNNNPPPQSFAPAPLAPGKVRNPYSDALYAKSHKPLHSRFEELHRVRADQKVVEATVKGVQQFHTGPRNKHGVLLPA